MSALSAAIGAGAGAVADQATGLINSETKVNAEKELMAAREQMQMRLNEAQEQTRRSGNAYDFEQAGVQQPTVLERSAAASKQADTNTQASKTAEAAGNVKRVLTEADARKNTPGYAAAVQAQLDQESAGAKQTREAKIKYESQMGAAAGERAKALNTRAAGSTTTEEARQKYMAIVEMELDPNLPPEERAALVEQKQGYLNIIQKGARAAATGGKDDEKTAQNLANGYLKTAKALEDGGNSAAAQALREKAQAILDGIGERQTDKGKGAAAKIYPAAPEAHNEKFNLRLTEAKRKFPDVKGKSSPGFEREKALIISAFEKTYGPGAADAVPSKPPDGATGRTEPSAEPAASPSAKPAASPSAKPAATGAATDPRLVGLSSLALKRIADNPNHPLADLADAELKKLGVARDAAMQERMSAPDTDPSLYHQE